MNTKFADKLAELRHTKGWSQEMLAETLGVSRQAVSKWEAGRTLPDVPKLIAIAELFGVSLDELLRDTKAGTAQNPEAPVAVGPLLSLRAMNYEYKSKAKLFGIPLVHIHSRHGWGPPAVARGIIAIGDVAVGIMAIGGLGFGLFTFAGLGVGLLACLGGVAVGAFALGGLAVGAFALGGLAVGLWAVGGAAIGGQMAAGGYANAPVAVGMQAVGELAYLTDAAPPPFAQFQQEVLEMIPRTPKAFIRLAYQVFLN